ncbi:carbamoyl phosphate synthase small subunit [Sporolactobacillus sp. THM7-4]|nr:carbamoyl phosphate synthase small subunit [Sporolactobacillus sp. THM7-4]
MKKGYLLLESGEVYSGVRVGKQDAVLGEIVFNTSMTGYQEIMTDPSYAGQIMTFCYPLIGNYGINPNDSENKTIHMKGAIFSNLCSVPSHYQSIETVDEWLKQSGVPGLAGIDTRAVVKKVRQSGTMKAIISDTPEVPDSAWNRPLPRNLISRVSTKKLKVYEGKGPHIALFDYGYKKSMLTSLIDMGCKVTVVPYNTSFETLASLDPDGVLLSNGPGDPMQLSSLFGELKKITSSYPTLGICLGHQLVASAYGAKTGKLLFGHRGANHPVKETATGKVWMTSQNHSYVVTKESINKDIFTVTYLNVNDGSVEGLKHNSLPIETVQYHPEAHPGPCDTHPVFKRFIDTIKEIKGEATHAVTY